MSARDIIRDLIANHHISAAERAYNEHEEGADRIIAALAAAGFTIVPNEPTEAMMNAAYQAQIDEANYKPWPTDPSGAEYVSEWVCARIAYRAMLSATNQRDAEQ